MSDLTDAELQYALNGECSSAEVVVWLAREVKRYRDAQSALVTETMQPDTPETPQPHDRSPEASLILLSGNAPLEIFPFVTAITQEVLLRHKDDESQDIEMTPDEADCVADRLRAAAVAARLRAAEVAASLYKP